MCQTREPAAPAKKEQPPVQRVITLIVPNEFQESFALSTLLIPPEIAVFFAELNVRIDVRWQEPDEVFQATITVDCIFGGVNHSIDVGYQFSLE